MRNTLLICLACISLSSCSKYKVQKKLKGLWILEEMKYQGNDVFADFLTNAIELKSSEAILPGKYDNEKTSWNLSKNGEDYFIEFSSKEDVFKGKFKIIFYSEGGFNKVNLVSATTNLKCSKSEFQELPKR